MSANPKTDYRSKLGPIPPEHFDNDLPFKPDSEIDKSPGSLYDITRKRIEETKKRTQKEGEGKT
jgi:hypothetical protein